MELGHRTSPGQILTDYWQGKLDFLITFAGGLLGLRAFLALTQSYLPTTAPFLVIAFWALLNGLVFTWQIVGATRKVHSIQSNTNDPMLVWCGWGAIFAACILTFNQALDLLTISSPSREQILLANYSKPMLPVSDDGKIAYIKGDLNYNTNTGLLNALKEYPDLSTVSIESNGGLVFAARALARNILKFKLDTTVELVCSSSCSLVFAAGKSRTLGKNGKIGFHQYALATRYHTNTLNIKKELQKDRIYFADRGFTPAFIARIFTEPPDRMWYPTRDELLSGNVISQ